MTPKKPLALLALLALGACGDKEVPPPPPCDRKCQDSIAMRGLRETMKYTFNKTFQGKPYGRHELETDEFIFGSAKIQGVATSLPEIGVTDVTLTYEFSQATYIQKNVEPRENFRMVVTGVVSQKGLLAVQPSSPTSLLMKSEAITLVGDVYDPPIKYNVELASCPIVLNQSGNSVSGWICNEEEGQAGFEF